MRISTAIAFLLISLTVFSQEYTFRRFTKEDGLPGNSVRCFLKDQQGFIWIGTAQGLCKYDGYQFKHYTRNSGFDISDDFINALYQDKAGNLWIGTETGGVNIYYQKFDSIVTMRYNANDLNSIPGDRVRNIVQDSYENTWIGFDNGIGLSRIDSTGKIKNFDPFTSISGKGVRAIRDIIVDKWRPDTLWVATTSGLIAFNTKKETFHLVNHPLKSVHKYGLFAASQISQNQILGGFFYAGTDIYHIEENSWKETYDLDEGIKIFDAVRKPEGEVWLAARKRGLALLNLQNDSISFIVSDLKNFESPFPGFTRTVYEDNRALWVGGENGISYYDGIGALFPFDSLPFLSKEFGRITSASGKYDKIYLTGIKHKGLWEIDKITSEKKLISIKQGIPPNISSMLELKDQLLLLDEHKIYVFDKNWGSIEEIKASQVIDSSHKMHTIKRWNNEFALILTALNGIFKMHLKTFEISPLIDKGATNTPSYLFDACVVKDGSIWIATQEHVLVFDPENSKFSNYRPASILSEKHKVIYSIREDRDGVKWIGTESGLIRLEDGKEKLFNTQNSDLASNYIDQVLLDTKQNVWLATDVGISRLDRDSQAIFNYDYDDGVSSSGAFELIDDQILVGSYGGYSLFHPDSIQSDSPLLISYLTNFKVLNEEYDLPKAIDFMENVTLDYWQNFISIGYTSPSFAKGEKIRFAYQLEGLDHDWINPTNGRYANYTNLDGGDYIFKVKARMEGGDWGPTKSVKIHIKLPFWETWWFYTLCAIMVLGIGLSTYKARIRVIQRKADLEAQELRIDALQKRLMDLNASPPDLSLDIDKLNSKLTTPLSDREFEVLKMSLDGKSNTEIGNELFISVSTVKFHLRNTYSKLGVSNRKEALVYVVKKS